MASTISTPSSTSSPWFYCGACGFANHPRLGQNPLLCEQCGAVKDASATDYKPVGA